MKYHALLVVRLEGGLALSPEKTKVTHIEEGFDFLGWNIRKYNGTSRLKPTTIRMIPNGRRISSPGGACSWLQRFAN